MPIIIKDYGHFLKIKIKMRISYFISLVLFFIIFNRCRNNNNEVAPVDPFNISTIQFFQPPTTAAVNQDIRFRVIIDAPNPCVIPKIAEKKEGFAITLMGYYRYPETPTACVGFPMSVSTEYIFRPSVAGVYQFRLFNKITDQYDIHQVNVQ
ncbi:MAG: hypothetical protein EAZ06_03010 [Cytophagales bacterium]|nr:MAG: hypothetical protein EAZ06_03010 [Cytophagales bacterium]